MAARDGARSWFEAFEGRTLDNLRLSVESSDDTLVKACLEGRAIAWDLLLERYAQLIYSVPRRFRLSDDDAADVFQNVCVSLWRHLDSLHDHKSIARWLITVAQRECIEVFNRQKRDFARLSAVDEADNDLDTLRAEVPDIPDLIQQLEEEQKLRLALAKLPERCQQLLRLLYFDARDLSYAEIAAQLNLGSTAVGINRARCLERLRKLLAEADP